MPGFSLAFHELMARRELELLY